MIAAQSRVLGIRYMLSYITYSKLVTTTNCWRLLGLRPVLCQLPEREATLLSEGYYLLDNNFEIRQFNMLLIDGIAYHKACTYRRHDLSCWFWPCWRPLSITRLARKKKKKTYHDSSGIEPWVPMPRWKNKGQWSAARTNQPLTTPVRPSGLVCAGHRRLWTSFKTLYSIQLTFCQPWQIVSIDILYLL